MRTLVRTALAIVLASCVPAAIGSSADEPLERENTPGGDEEDGEKLPSTGDGGGSSSGKPTLNVTLKGTGTGIISSTPTGVTCTGTTCKGTFAAGTTVTLVAAPNAGSVFTGWSGACTGTATCAPAVNGEINVNAEFALLGGGTWKGTYDGQKKVDNCFANNKGDLTMTITQNGTALQSSVAMTGIDLREVPACTTSGTAAGTSGASPITMSGIAMTGTWTVNVSGTGGSHSYPFSATITGNTMTGTWTCANCPGGFTLTKQ